MIKGVIFDFGDTIIVEESGKSISDMGLKKTDGLDEALRVLKRQNLGLGIIANTINSTEREVRVALRNAGIENFFEFVTTSVDVGVRKPTRAIFHAALNAMDLEPSEAVMVGNQIDSDIVGGNRIGMTTVWFHWNDRYEQTISSRFERPDYVISSLRDLPHIINELIPEDESKRKRQMEYIARKVRGCRRCPLYRTRIRAVPGCGSHNPRIMFVGEAPGKREDEEGRPFAGAAGKILDTALENLGLKRRDIFITSVLKCRPPKNRNPRKAEMEACRPYLLAQIESLNPTVIVALGFFGLKGLTGKSIKVAKARRRDFDFDGIPIISTYHPAACLYNRRLARLLKRDLGKALER